MFRLADAARLKEIIYRGPEMEWEPAKKVKRISRSTTQYVPFRGISTSDPLDLLEAEYKVLLLEYTDQSIPIWDFQPAENQKYLLVAGHEETGVSTELIAAGYPAVHLPMMGMNTSMNVTVATGIAVYDLLGKMLNSFV